MKRHIVLIQIFLVDCGIVIICLRLSFQFVGILAGELRQLGNWHNMHPAAHFVHILLFSLLSPQLSTYHTLHGQRLPRLVSLVQKTSTGQHGRESRHDHHGDQLHDAQVVLEHCNIGAWDGVHEDAWKDEEAEGCDGGDDGEDEGGDDEALALLAASCNAKAAPWSRLCSLKEQFF